MPCLPSNVDCNKLTLLIFKEFKPIIPLLRESRPSTSNFVYPTGDPISPIPNDNDNKLSIDVLL